MIQLDAESRSALRRAVNAGIGRADVIGAVEAVYASLQDAIDLRKPICTTSGRCCHFESFGHRLFVTTAELAAFATGLDDSQSRPEWNGEGCPFQVAKLCSVHRIRPFGCRVFFCDETAADWQKEQYERFHQILRRTHEDLGLAYFYVEWRVALEAMGWAETLGK